ncbi:hypothetical protein Nepgr_014304 [Nepenthes gracilis]|uniref:RNA helicase n=1 Tax=Nepenthes gracilis TaxID=150966 RepID=A0AAD3XPQ8_NEPGR|nr:hypothetical protein Nepgr_014304 [Nepenthes gracilis]
MKISPEEIAGSPDSATANCSNHKPVFLSKSRREQLALQRRQEETAQRNRRSEKLLLQCRSGENKSSSDSHRHRSSGNHDRDPKRTLGEYVKARERPKLEELAEREREEEIEAIKEQYLGSRKPKKRVVKPSEKFRFSFDWDITEEAISDTNPLYQNRHEAQLLFGRGFRAGVDRREQKKQAAESRTVEHWSEKKLEEMTERDWRIFREDFDISYKGTKVSKRMRNWREGNLSSELLKAVEKEGYKKPSPIQMAAIPLGLQLRDVIGIAETGSGKTAAFVLPMLSYISGLPPISEETGANGPYAVVLAPTRELAQQIERKTGCEIIIATPGRLLDCLESRYCVLNRCSYVVLDEADRMIDQGFESQIVGVLDSIPSIHLKPLNKDEELDEMHRITHMFTATMSPAVERLARKYLRNPVVVTVGTARKATGLVSQHVLW